MEKTPIALLGEYTVKKNPPLPNYIYLGDRMIGANDHEFSFKIIYHEFSVIGKGPTKQMAKHNAAQEMLTLLGQNNSSNNNIKSLLTSTNSLNIQNESPETGINYIGLIHVCFTFSRSIILIFISKIYYLNFSLLGVMCKEKNKIT